MTEYRFDAAVIGAGAAGMAAACPLAERGKSVVLIDRESAMGGILLQCVHNGFGLHHFGEELTGPEFAGRLERDVARLGIPFWGDTTVLSIKPLASGGFALELSSAARGVSRLVCGAVILAMGSRERNRGNLRIAGDRPSGVYTAGLVQHLINIEGYLPGRRAVIIGSGDIGLIMARRLSLSGAKVEAVVEIQSFPSGLTRNVVQCLDDFDIPLYLAHATLRIIGRDRVTGVEVAPLVGGSPRLEAAFTIPCDTVLLSVGLVPENELSARSGVSINPVTNGPTVDSRLMTSVPGIFAAGNVLHIHDLVDRVAEEAFRAGVNCADWLDRAEAAEVASATEVSVVAGKNVRYTVPSSIDPASTVALSLRVMIPMDRAVLTVSRGGVALASRKLSLIRPGEMIRADFAVGELEGQGVSPFEVSIEPIGEGTK